MSRRANKKKSSATNLGLNQGKSRHVLNVVRKIQDGNGDVSVFRSLRGLYQHWRSKKEVDMLLKNIVDHGILTKEGYVYKLTDRPKIENAKQEPKTSPDIEREVTDISFPNAVVNPLTEPQTSPPIQNSTEEEDNQNQQEL